jgi:hypothetical protein
MTPLDTMWTKCRFLILKLTIYILTTALQSDEVSNLFIKKFKIYCEFKLNTLFCKNLKLKVLLPLSTVLCRLTCAILLCPNK